MNDRLFHSDRTSILDFQAFKRMSAHPSASQPRPTDRWALSPEQDAFLRDRFSITLEDPNTGKRVG